jgi:hypothetical protein
VSTHQIHVFISHSWSYSGHYQTLAQWIFGQPWHVGQASLDLRNYSIPADDPIHNVPTSKALGEAIYRHISRSHVIVIPTGMYTNYSRWIMHELDGADGYKKPILAVNPWGQERTSSVVRNRATDYCGWNRDPLIGKIWNLYRERYL